MASVLTTGIYLDRIPDTPIIYNDLTVSHATQIKVKWYPPADTGGQSLIDYRLQWDQGTGVWVDVYSSTQLTEWFVEDLTTG